MPDQGEQASEPTSYGLQPPAPRAAYEPTQAGAPQPATPEPERLIGGRYRLRSRLGHGGMGTVWRAHDEAVDREVAVKEPRVPDHLSEQERQTFYKRMRREARAAAKIDHPSVVTVHDVVVEDGSPWIVMELVNGRSLGDALAEGTLDQREAARIGLAVLGALAAAHGEGVLHRDVKPDNVLLGRHDRVVLTDFGIAQVEGEQGLTETGAFVGSPEFIAPERVLGQRPGPESDLWSLGVVLYAAVEGMSPFRRSNTPATLQAVLSAEPQAPARGSGALGSLIMQLLRKDPAARPDVAEVRGTLESVASPPQPTALAPMPGIGTGSGLTRKAADAVRGSRRARFGLLGGALAVVGALLFVLLDPFGDGLPEGWERHDEEGARASIAVPSDWRREEGESFIRFASRDGIFWVQVWLRKEEEATALEAAEKLLDRYKEPSFGLEDVSGHTAETEYRGEPAAEVTMTSVPRRSDEGTPRDQRVGFFYGGGGGELWRVLVRMPGEDGEVKSRGEQIHDGILEHIEFRQAEDD